ncbi:acyclic terpene utilization AtuA family protein [Candidatus Palauibacter sp.]|uniref:acyclic terpene utilization AtuA family protein n=1 Tax=Candidatus Palauibacter sp. TaxID=3101350 RepID=UPI003AF311EB
MTEPVLDSGTAVLDVATAEPEEKPLPARAGPGDGRTVRVASGQGFWGDWQEAPKLQVRHGAIDYLMLDYLAEITMSIMQKQRDRKPEAGYARDFVPLMEDLIEDLIAGDVRVVSNAGGVNPEGCRTELGFAFVGKSLPRRPRVAVITGDDLMDSLDDLIAAGHELRHMETGAPLSTVRGRVAAANAYLGAEPIIEALRQEADIVVAGRSTDTALTYAPLMHEFSWRKNDWDRLAHGVVAGHINECGCQASGGNSLVDWREIDLTLPATRSSKPRKTGPSS